MQNKRILLRKFPDRETKQRIRTNSRTQQIRSQQRQKARIRILRRKQTQAFRKALNVLKLDSKTKEQIKQIYLFKSEGRIVIELHRVLGTMKAIAFEEEYTKALRLQGLTIRKHRRLLHDF
ncbi:MAG: hypothetical protein Q7S92_06475 [Candidatus Diapherotrites archaeon]|nr:hypothetical protein [Candidatus Diapherotrites archaeon]